MKLFRSSLPVKPYHKVERLDFENAVLDIKDIDFNGIPFQPGTIVLAFFNCRIMNLEIVNSENINFEEVSIAFFDCFIGSMTTESISSSNISIGCYSSLISGRVDNDKLTSFELNNCISPNSLFLFNIPKIRISYSKENIMATHWMDLAAKLNIKLEDIPASSFHTLNIGEFRCSSNFGPDIPDYFRPKINIAFDKQIDTLTVIEGLSLLTLGLSGKPAGIISIENIKVGAWYIYNFYPEGNVIFQNIEPIVGDKGNIKIGIHKSVLDDVQFDNIAFDQFPVISIFRTKIAKAIFTSCDFPRNYDSFSNFVPIENVHYPDKKTKNGDKALYEIFLQLKKGMDDMGNYYESQKLQAMAHEALRRMKSIPTTDRNILRINNLSNDHGLSIWRPIWGFLIFSIVFYILYLTTLDRMFNKTEVDWNLIGYYFSFVDLTHRSDFLVPKECLNGWALSIDFLAKLLVGFFAYQFIAAFRKYGKTK